MVLTRIKNSLPLQSKGNKNAQGRPKVGGIGNLPSYCCRHLWSYLTCLYIIKRVFTTQALNLETSDVKLPKLTKLQEIITPIAGMSARLCTYPAL